MSLALVLFSIQITESAEPNKKEIKIRAYVQQMHSTCANICPEKNTDCLNECYGEHIDQWHNFLTRKAIGKCSWGFSEEFSFKTGTDLFHDLYETSKAMDELEYDTVRACTNRRLIKYSKTLDAVAYK